MTSADAFRSLSGTVLPPGVERRTGSSGFSGKLEGQSFADLLANEARGKISSARPVAVRPESGVKLTPDQMSRLGVAIDRAEAAGAQHALVMMDGMALKVDVGVRQVVEQVDLKSATVTPGIDAVIHAGETKKIQTIAPPVAGFHPSLSKILGKEPDA